MLDRVLQQVDANEPAALDRLCELLRIQSISTDPRYAVDCQSAANWVQSHLERCGLDVQVYPTEGHPVVVGRWDGAGPDAPRLLFYGHYDVQPPDPLDQWTSPPFEPTLREGRIYARGASDDKGQTMCFIEAMRAWREAIGSLPVNITVLIEGEEECGSVHLDGFVEQHADELRADVAVISDTAMWAPHRPAITYGLRGLLYLDVQLHGPSRDLHSGVYGGSVANPATELVLVLGQLFDEAHRVTLDGFYDRVVEPDDRERRRWAELDFDETEWARSVGLEHVHGERGYGTLERKWARPSCDINGLYGGYTGPGAKTVIPTFAGAKVSFRLAPEQDPHEIEQAMRRWLEQRTPPGCTWRIRQHGAARPVLMPTDSPWLAAAERAIEAGCGRKPVLMREGATIPVVATFKRLLGIDTLLIGFGLHDDALHSPNEKFDLDNFRMGRRTHAALLAMVGHTDDRKA